MNRNSAIFQRAAIINLVYVNAKMFGDEGVSQHDGNTSGSALANPPSPPIQVTDE
jgi:hypothetical protein